MWMFPVWAVSLIGIGMGVFILYVILPAWLAAYLTVMDRLFHREAVEIHEYFDPSDIRRSLRTLAVLTCMAVGCILLGAFIIATRSGLAPDWWYRHVTVPALTHTPSSVRGSTSDGLSAGPHSTTGGEIAPGALGGSGGRSSGESAMDIPDPLRLGQWLGIVVFFLIAPGGFFLYLGLHGLVVAFLTGVTALTGKEFRNYSGLFKRDDPWRTILHCLGFTCAGGAVCSLGIMIILGELGWAPQWWIRWWEGFVIGQ